MNEVINNILSRRSVRTYKPEQIPDSDLNAILEAAKYAPSGMNAQGWHFTAVQNKEKLQSLNQLVKNVLLSSQVERLKERASKEDFSFYHNAPTLVIVSYDKSFTPALAVSDCAVALQNIFLSAHSLGISSCWVNTLVGGNSTQEIRTMLTELGIPEQNIVHGCATLGYNAGEEPPAPKRKQGVINIVK